MDAKKPSTRSRTRSSAGRSKAGSVARLPPRELLARIDREVPATLYLEGPEESIKAALLAEIRHAWAERCPEAPAARVFRAAESGVDEILAAFLGVSLFAPRELSIVLDIEDLGRS